jgi:hypothetical protein
MLTLDDLAPFDGPRPPGRKANPLTGSPARWSPTRRAFVRGAFVAGTAVGLTALDWLPTARRAWGSHADDDIKANCTGLGSWVNDDDCFGCNQTTTHCCCASSGWHLHDGVNYVLRPDQCDPGNYDGWRWLYTPCCGNGYKNQEWRCHDGKRKLSDGTWQNTVCKKRLKGCTPCCCPQCDPCNCV